MSNAKKNVERGIEQLDLCGMPVGYLRHVVRHCGIEQISSGVSSYKPFLDEIELKKSVVKSLSEFVPGLPLGEAAEIGTLYHEAAHAYIDINSDKAVFAEVIKHGREYYEGAELDDSSETVVEDENRVFQEAIATYCGHRATVWYLALDTLVATLEMLKEAEAGTSPPTEKECSDIAIHVGEIRHNYDKGIAKRIFGYEEFGLFSSRQVYTKKPISAKIKNFADAKMLEGKIPDIFIASPDLKKYYDNCLTLITTLRRASYTKP